MVFTIQKSRAAANPESPPRDRTEIIIREVSTPRWTVLTQEQSVSFVQKLLQYSQEKEGEYFHYHVLCLNESSTEDDIQKTIVKWLFYQTLEKQASTGFCYDARDNRG